MQPEQLPNTTQPASPSPPPMPFEVPNSVAAPMPSATTSTPTDDTPQIADDGDLIEKDWIAKIKQILSATAHSPYEQSKQLTALKADYLQKRYGKVIKAEE